MNAHAAAALQGASSRTFSAHVLHGVRTPPAREGHSCSMARTGAVLFGGLHPGLRHLADFGSCSLSLPPALDVAEHLPTSRTKVPPPTVEWTSLPIHNVPPRCYHGATMIESSQKLVIFGGQATGSESRESDGPCLLDCLNDTWLVDVSAATATPIIADEGVPPKPRMHHTCSALPTEQSGAVRIVVTGGVQGGSIPEKEDCLHILKVGTHTSTWHSGEAVIKASAESAVAKTPPFIHPTRRFAGNVEQAVEKIVQQKVASVAAAIRTQFDVLQRYAHTASVSGSQLLLFGGRLASGAASNSLISICADENVLSVNTITPSGTAPAPRYGHAAALVGPGDGAPRGPCIIIHGGRDGKQIFADVLILHVPSQTWSLLHAPASLKSRLFRHAHSLAILRTKAENAARDSRSASLLKQSSSEGPLMLLFGGYAERGFQGNESVMIHLPPSIGAVMSMKPAANALRMSMRSMSAIAAASSGTEANGM